MSDLQDIIARSAVHAYNSGMNTGLATGKQQERERFVRILGELKMDDKSAGEYAYVEDIIEYVFDEDYQ